jgi:hypothetical protein
MVKRRTIFVLYRMEALVAYLILGLCLLVLMIVLKEIRKASSLAKRVQKNAKGNPDVALPPTEKD